MPHSKARLAICAVLLPLCFLLSCRIKPLDVPETQSGTTALDTITLPPDIAEGEPTYDFGGQVWRFRAPWASRYLPSGDGSAWDELLWSSYQEIAGKYHVIINILPIDGLENVLPSFASGQNVPDVLGLSGSELASAASMGHILPVEDPYLAAAGLNPADNRWHQGLSEQLRWKGQQWAVQVSSEAEQPSFGTMLLYNRDIMKTIGAFGLENMLEAGLWTWEYYWQLSDAITALPSTWTHGAENIVSFLAQGGMLPVSLSRTGAWRSNIMEVPMQPSVAFFRTAMAEERLFTGTWEEIAAQYAEGRIAFLWISSQTLQKNPELLRPSFTSGILPPPQADGQTPSASLSEGYQGYAITAASPNKDKAVALLNAWALRVNDKNWLSIYGRQLSLSVREQTLIQNHLLPFRLANTAELSPAITAAIHRELLVPIAAEPGWSVIIRSDANMTKYLSSFNAE